MKKSYNNCINYISSLELDKVNKDYDVVIYNTFFNVLELSNPPLPNYQLLRKEKIKEDLSKIFLNINEGGLLFVYGLPAYLSSLGVFLNNLSDDKNRLIFKYWIAMEYKPEVYEGCSLPCSHVGMLMYLKSSSKNLTSFSLNTKKIRTPYRKCIACNQNVKDWGGKKHLLNDLGAAISDVWEKIDRKMSTSSILSDDCIDKIYQLCKQDNFSMLVITQEELIQLKENKSNLRYKNKTTNPFSEDTILNEDSIQLMIDISKKYPDGIFDMVFADPPYNLGKKYGMYQDTKKDQNYVEWCNEWLELCTKVLRPGGSLFVLNIPKWAIYHADFLNNKMKFGHWIVWNALSSPTGKIMPSHYALLYYVKSGNNVTYDYPKEFYTDSRQYCLRTSCTKKRKRLKDDKKELMSDIWNDIHRIKHKKDRDVHPCQLPIKLLKRIIEISTNPGDWIFDPFSGTGTTAVASRICNRHFVVSDIDSRYMNITKMNLNLIRESVIGEKYYERESIEKRRKKKITKKEVEVEFIAFVRNSKVVPSLEELKNLNPNLHNKILYGYNDYNFLRKITRRRLEIEEELNNDLLNLTE